MLSCAPELSWPPGHAVYNWYHIPLTTETDFKESAKKIDELVQAAHTIIVYCHQGTNQSVSAVIAYLILYKSWPFFLAVSHVMRLKYGASPNRAHISLIETFQPLSQCDQSKKSVNQNPVDSQKLEAKESCSQVAAPSPSESEGRSTHQTDPSNSP